MFNFSGGICERLRFVVYNVYIILSIMLLYEMFIVNVCGEDSFRRF